MSEELSLYRAVTACRQGIALGLHPRVAVLTAAEKYRVSPGVVADLAHRAEIACQAAREALSLTSASSPETMDSDAPGMALGEFARLIGKSPSYVTKLKQAGRLVMVSERRVDAEASRQLIEKTTIGGTA